MRVSPSSPTSCRWAFLSISGRERAMAMTRDARPFVAHYLRGCADADRDGNGDALHTLARWIENLPRHDRSMRRIAATDALDYADGSFRCGDAGSALIASYRDDAPDAR